MFDLSQRLTGPQYICGLALRAMLLGLAMSALAFGLSEFVQSLADVRLPVGSDLAWLRDLATTASLWLGSFGLLSGKVLVALLAAPLTARRALTLGMSKWLGAGSLFLALLGPGDCGLSSELNGWEIALSPPIWLVIVLGALRADQSVAPDARRFGVAYRAWSALFWVNVALVAMYGALTLSGSAYVEEFVGHTPVGKLGTLFALLSMCLLMIDRSRSLRETPLQRRAPIVALKTHTSDSVRANAPNG